MPDHPLPSATPPENPLIQSTHAELSALFQDLGQKLVAQIIDPEGVGAALREKISVESDTLTGLLDEWAHALLGLLRHQKILVSQIHVVALKSQGSGFYELQAEITGELLDPLRHALNPGAKAQKAQVGIEKTALGYEARIQLRA